MNNTGVPITKLRFRVVHITTLGTPNEFSGAVQADVRPVTSSGETVTVNAPCVGTATSRNVQGLTLDTPPAQTSNDSKSSCLSRATSA